MEAQQDSRGRDGVRTVFFCIGAAKSGTTLLARVLDQHPDVACMWESYAFHPRSKSSIFNPDSDSWRKHGFSEADVRRWAAIWRAEPRSFLRRALRKLTGRTFLAADCFRRTMPEALADFAQRCGAAVVGDKWPWYIDHLDDVLAVFPEARYVYNVRDPRGLWNSAQRFKGRGRGDELVQRMLRAETRVAPYLDQPNFLTLRYEDLVNQPEVTCEELFTFLGCGAASERGLSRETLQYDPASDPYPSRWEWVPEASQPFDPWHAVKWREQMSRQEIEQITERTGWFIERYDYER
jgi:hypothetical protein